MPRRRMVDPQIWRNEKVGKLPDAGRLLFIGIFSQADDDGRLKASPRFLMANIFPYDKDKTEEDVKRLRDQCAELGLIRLYTNNKEEYLDIPGWHEHQQIRKDRYTPSTLPSFEESDNQPTTRVRPTGNQLATTDEPNIIKSSLVKSKTPKGARKKRADPIVNEIFTEMRSYLGYPDRVKEDPIPSYGKEGQAIKRMLARGFTREEILACWKGKVSQRGGEFVSMTWVNEDIGKKGGKAKGQLSTTKELKEGWKQK
ncbi:hypothetical protein ES703_78772 [subsurface metagenome]